MKEPKERIEDGRRRSFSLVVSPGRGTAQRGIDRLIMRARGRQMGQTAPRAVIRAFLAFGSILQPLHVWHGLPCSFSDARPDGRGPLQ